MLGERLRPPVRCCPQRIFSQPGSSNLGNSSLPLCHAALGGARPDSAGLSRYASEEMQADLGVVTAAVTNSGSAIRYASEALQANSAVVKLAVAQCGMALKFAAPELRADRSIALTAAGCAPSPSPSATQACNPSNVGPSLLAAIGGLDVVFAGHRLTCRPCASHLTALAHFRRRQTGYAVEFMSEELRADKSVALACVTTTGNCVSLLPKELREDAEVMLQAVKQYGLVLMTNGTREQKATKDLAVAATAQNGHVLKCLAPELKEDFEVVLAAVSHNGLMLEHASDTLRAHKDIALAAMAQNQAARAFVAPELQVDPAFKKETSSDAAREALKSMAFAAPAPKPAAKPVAVVAAVGSGGPKDAFIFPGQGSQSVGMVQEVKDLPAVAAMFDTAKNILGYDLLELMKSGPEEKLQSTEFCQPAMFVAGLCAVEKLRTENPSLVEGCGAAAGLSLGEYTALTFAGALSFEDGLKLVKVRPQPLPLLSC